MKETVLTKGKSFFAAFLASTASVVWLCMFTVALWQILLISVLAVIVVFLPLKQAETVTRLFWVISSVASFAIGVKLMGRLHTETPLWSWWLGWGILLILLCYLGKDALYECAVLPAMLFGVALLLSFGSSLASFDGAIEWRGSPWQWTTGGAVLLVGNILMGLEIAPHKNAAKAGALTGVLVWGLVALIPLIMWTGEAIGIVNFALPFGWQRLDLISFMGCPDVLLCAMVAVSALWLSACGVTTLMKLKQE